MVLDKNGRILNANGQRGGWHQQGPGTWRSFGCGSYADLTIRHEDILYGNVILMDFIILDMYWIYYSNFPVLSDHGEISPNVFLVVSRLFNWRYTFLLRIGFLRDISLPKNTGFEMCNPILTIAQQCKLNVSESLWPQNWMNNWWIVVFVNMIEGENNDRNRNTPIRIIQDAW